MFMHEFIIIIKTDADYHRVAETSTNNSPCFKPNSIKYLTMTEHESLKTINDKINLFENL